MSSIRRYINGFELIRKIGQGGFGTVYLSKDNKSGNYIALKILEGESASKELNFLSSKIGQLENCQYNHIMPILECYKFEGGIFYTMPLSDSLFEEYSPESEFWRPKSLDNFLKSKESNPSTAWFSEAEIFDIANGLFCAVLALSNASILHRDIKPANILFLKNEVMLSDFSIAEKDVNFENLEERGSEFFSAPQGYISKGGNPDMWSVAATLFKVCTGYSLDFVDRSSATFPKRQIVPITNEQKKRYNHWKRCILKAISEDRTIRFLRIKDFRDAFFSDDFNSSKIGYDVPTFSQHKAYYNVKIDEKGDFFNDIVAVSKKRIEFKKSQILNKKHQAECLNAINDYMTSKDYSKAIEILDNLIITSANEEFYAMRGVCKYSLQQYREALSDYDLAIAQNAEYARAYHGKSLCYTMLSVKELLSIKDSEIEDSKAKDNFLSYEKLAEINMRKAAILGDEKAKRLITH